MTSPTPEPTVQETRKAVRARMQMFASTLENPPPSRDELLDEFERAIVRRERERSSALLEAARKEAAVWRSESPCEACGVELSYEDAQLSPRPDVTHKDGCALGGLLAAITAYERASLAETPEEAK